MTYLSKAICDDGGKQLTLISLIIKSPFDPPPLDGSVVALHKHNIMIMTFCSYARILKDLFQFDIRCSYTSVAYGRPLTTKTSNVTYLTLTLHQRYASHFLLVTCLFLCEISLIYHTILVIQSSNYVGTCIVNA